MQRVLNLYVRYFNRARRRDGSLFRGRFGSRVVNSEAYLRTLLRYIDQNAPKARLVHDTARYPWGSARHYVAARRPRWLGAAEIDRRMGDPAPEEREAAYRRAFGARLTAAEQELVRLRITKPSADGDDLDDLIAAAPDRVLGWMLRKARIADHTSAGQAYASPAWILAALDASPPPEPGHGGSRGRPSDALLTARSGLLRDLAGLTQRQIATRVGGTLATVRRRVSGHARRLLEDAAYATWARDVASAALRRLCD
jgi:hypothetical protein